MPDPGFYIGCPIWANKEWVGTLYPKGTKSADFLKIYARKLNTVEGNTTFYAVPSPDTLQHWVDETPETFRFCPKVPRTISHAGKLMDHREETEAFITAMSRLGSRLGPIFLQLPPTYGPALADDLRDFLDAWPAGVRLAVEVRHLAWFGPRVHGALQSLLAARHMARVTIDTRPIRALAGDPVLRGSVYQRMLLARERKPDVPVVSEPTAGFTFLRYIGHPLPAQNEEFLEEWAARLAEWRQQGLEPYVFCHCPEERVDPLLCEAFYQRVSARAPLPPLAPEPIDSEPRQERLF
jgi:uncharacterized protein YecE (DUF72 family)